MHAFGGVSRNVKALGVCVLALLAAALAAGVEPGRACSCALPDARVALAQADGAFVGKLVRREDAGTTAVLTYTVERGLKGGIAGTVAVRTASSGASCGIEAPLGTRVGLLLERRGGAWHGHLCWQFNPDELLAAAKPLPTPNGRGPAALVVAGQFGPMRLLALDGKGRTLAYGRGIGTATAASVCPGRRRAAELAYTGSAWEIAVRELRTLRLVRRQTLALVSPSTIRCMRPSGEQLVVFSGSGPDLDKQARLVRITPSTATTIWRGMSWHASLTERHAYVTELRRDTLIAVDLHTRAVKKLASMPKEAFYLTPNEARTRFASLASTEGVGEPRLVVVDVRRSPARVRTVRLPSAIGGVVWLDRGRLAVLQHPSGVVLGPRLQVVSRFAWQAEFSVLLNSKVFGVSRDGTLVSAAIPGGPSRVVRRLPGRPEAIVSVVR